MVSAVALRVAARLPVDFCEESVSLSVAVAIGGWVPDLENELTSRNWWHLLPVNLCRLYKTKKPVWREHLFRRSPDRLI
jgi:hypothetical protein